MVVPHRDDRHGGAQGPQIAIGVIARIALAVVGQRVTFGTWVGLAPEDAGQGLLRACEAGLVDVVAQHQRRIEAAAVHGMRIGVELPDGIGRAGEDGKPHLLRAAHRQGARMARGRYLALVAKAVVIVGGGCKPGDVDLDGEIALDVGGGRAGIHDGGERRIGVGPETFTRVQMITRSDIGSPLATP